MLKHGSSPIPAATQLNIEQREELI